MTERREAPTILAAKQHDALSVFAPANLLREARRQRGLPEERAGRRLCAGSRRRDVRAADAARSGWAAGARHGGARVMRWQADSRLGLCGAVLAALTVGGAALHETGRLGIGSEPRRDAFVAVCLVAGGVYLLAVRLVLRMLPTSASRSCAWQCPRGRREPLAPMPRCHFLRVHRLRDNSYGRSPATAACCVPSEPSRVHPFRRSAGAAPAADDADELADHAQTDRWSASLPNRSRDL